jgi:NTP pyrophosphatase (non-canonical NTP hydrolase)
VLGPVPVSGSELFLMSDETTPVSQLRTTVRQFVDERDWRQFHAPKNLSMALAVEASELMELFQWLTVDESRRIGEDETKFELVKEELSDVICYALAIANELDIDVSLALEAKMIKNRRKYPADEYRSKFEL